MLKIKLTRLGKKKEPRYRIVVNEARDKRDGQYVAQLGIYHPTATPKVLEIDAKAYQEWLKKGAQPTDTVAFLFERFQSGNPFPEKKPKLSKKAKAKLAAEKEAAEAAKAEAEEAKKAAAEAKTEEAAPEAVAEETAPAETEAAPEAPAPEETPAA